MRTTLCFVILATHAVTTSALLHHRGLAPRTTSLQPGPTHRRPPVRCWGSEQPQQQLPESDQGVIGGVGLLAAGVVLFSEATLKTTGCGLPAGPLGLVGLTEGLSYLSVVGLVGFSAYTKVGGGGLSARAH